MLSSFQIGPLKERDKNGKITRLGDKFQIKKFFEGQR